MIGQIISKPDQVCEHKPNCYVNAWGGISHTMGCPVLKQQWKEREKEQREARHQRFMAEARANLATIGGK